jgi:hypothetical protein
MATTKTTKTTAPATTVRKGISNTPAPTGPVVPTVLAGTVATVPTPTTPAASRTRKAAETVVGKPLSEQAAKTATAATAKKTVALAPKNAGVKAERGIDFLKKNAGKGFAVRDIEDGVGFPMKTLAGVLARLANTKDSGIVRVDVQRAGSTRLYKGFMFKSATAPAARKATPRKATPASSK